MGGAAQRARPAATGMVRSGPSRAHSLSVSASSFDRPALALSALSRFCSNKLQVEFKQKGGRFSSGRHGPGHWQRRVLPTSMVRSSPSRANSDRRAFAY